MTTASEILGNIEDDPVFKGFLEPAFDATGFASKIVSADVGRQAQLGSGGKSNGSTLDGGSDPIAQKEGLITGVGDRPVSAETVSSQAEITLDVSVPTKAQDLFLVLERRRL